MTRRPPVFGIQEITGIGRFLDIADGEFAALSRLIREQSGIHLSEQKRHLLCSRLSRRLRSLGLRSFREYCDFLRRDTSGEELSNMLDTISTNLTGFFREPAHFNYLEQHFFPAWRQVPVIRILSAGCSTGEEPYSIAMCAQRFFQGRASRVQITAVDISKVALTRAVNGVYQWKNVRALPPDLLNASFTRKNTHEGAVATIKPELRAIITFKRANVCEPLPFSNTFHAVFFRNVAIYFDSQTQSKVYDQMQRALVPAGTIFVGHSESIGRREGLVFKSPTVYERRAAGESR